MFIDSPYVFEMGCSEFLYQGDGDMIEKKYKGKRGYKIP
jgi:hypothetical protein